MIAPTNDRPLISFVVFAYNQEKYIREAIEGAFSQTYSPLEIILSDDCSTDGTFEVMRELRAAYAGPHSVRLNRNPHNLGVVGHVNRAMELAQGEIVVPSAGDDVSLPHRTALVHSLWEDSGGAARSLCVGLEPIYEEAAPPWRYTPRPDTYSLEEQIRWGGAKVVGATHAWHRSLFDVFGPLPEYLSEEDRVLPFRAALLGHIAHAGAVAVRYRVHGANLSQFQASAGSSAGATAHLKADLLDRQTRWLKAFRRDLLVAFRSGCLDVDRAAQYLDDLATVSRRTQCELDLYSSRLATRLAAAVVSWKLGTDIQPPHWRRMALTLVRVAAPYLYGLRLQRAARKALAPQKG